MKRVVNFLVSPLRLISRSIALLAAALLLIGGWGLTAFFQTAQVARDAVGSLTVSASAVAASVDVPIEQFADMSDAFRAGDLQTPDRVVLTTRLLRLQGALPPVGATFAVSATGQLWQLRRPTPPPTHPWRTPIGSATRSPTTQCRWPCSVPIRGCGQGPQPC